MQQPSTKGFQFGVPPSTVPAGPRMMQQLPLGQMQGQMQGQMHNQMQGQMHNQVQGQMHNQMQAHVQSQMHSQMQSHTSSFQRSAKTMQPPAARAMAPSASPVKPPENTDEEAPCGTLCNDYDEKVRPMIDLVDKLRRLGLDKDVDLPAIVVVGDQSAGKSSVLEAISGVQLPRGQGIVTRCPLELRLKRNTSVEWEGQVMFKDKKEELFDHDDVETKVREAQDAIAGHRKGISHELISLQVEGPQMPDLTLIDLPGITRVAVEGQDPAVPKQIKTMIQQYIQKENTIILAVVPANVDIATSDALSMAETIDAKGDRTLGVITKTDLLLHGEEEKLKQILNNESYNLKKGFVAVRCRDQHAINASMSLEKALESEDTFFKGSFLNEFFESDQCGIRALSSRLANELSTHIRKTLPNLTETIYSKLDVTRDKFAQLGEDLPDDSAEKMRFLNKLLHDYTDDLKKLSDGHEDEIAVDLRLHNMAKAHYEAFAFAIQKEVPQKRGTETNKIYGDFIKYIEKAIEDDTGRALPLFMRFDTFRRIVWTVIQKFMKPSSVCFNTVIDEVHKRLLQLASTVFQRYPKLEAMIKNILGTVIRDMKDLGTAAIAEMFELEKIVYTQAQTFTRAVENVNADKGTPHHKLTHSAAFADKAVTKRSEAEAMFTKVQAYLEICVLRVADVIPMLVTQHAILRVVERLRERVNDLVSPQHGAVAALEENPEEQRHRKNLKDRLERLEKAKVELQALV